MEDNQPIDSVLTSKPYNFNPNTLSQFLKEMAQKIDDKTIDNFDLLLAQEFHILSTTSNKLSVSCSNDINDYSINTFNNITEKEMLKYLICGWYIHSLIQEKKEVL